MDFIEKSVFFLIAQDVDLRRSTHTSDHNELRGLIAKLNG